MAHRYRLETGCWGPSHTVRVTQFDYRLATNACVKKQDFDAAGAKAPAAGAADLLCSFPVTKVYCMCPHMPADFVDEQSGPTPTHAAVLQDDERCGVWHFRGLFVEGALWDDQTP